MAKKTPELLTDTEVLNILRIAKAKNFYYYLIFRLLVKTGRRIGEIVSIRKMDIDFENKLIFLPVEKRRKKIIKAVFIDDRTLELIREWIKMNNFADNDYIFRHRSIRQLERVVQKYAKIAGITKYVCLHSFRHYFITWCRLKERMSYEEIRKITGHADVKTLSIYDRTEIFDIEEKAKRVVEKIGEEI